LARVEDIVLVDREPAGVFPRVDDDCYDLDVSWLDVSAPAAEMAEVAGLKRISSATPLSEFRAVIHPGLTEDEIQALAEKPSPLQIDRF
jgi:hypothetical protein